MDLARRLCCWHVALDAQDAEHPTHPLPGDYLVKRTNAIFADMTGEAFDYRLAKIGTVALLGAPKFAHFIQFH